MSVKISVVTPSYNQARFLEEALRSVLSQRDQIHEFFVLDGGSTDGSADIIRKYADRGIDYWHTAKDKGQADAIHQGFTKATGDVLCWLNSDDVFLPRALAKVHAAFDRHPDWDVLTGYHVRIDADSQIMALHRIPGESPAMSRMGVCHVAQQTCFFRKALYDRVGGISLDLHCVLDTELWYRMFAVGARWGHIPDFLAAFREHDAAKGQSWLKQYAEEYRIIRERHPGHIDTKWKPIGLSYYRMMQILSGRHVRGLMETQRYRGQKLTRLFGDWQLETEETMTQRDAMASEAGAT